MEKNGERGALNYKGYKITEESSGIFVEGVRDFHPVHTFECGQCFRWIRDEEGGYTGVVRDKVARIKFEEDILQIQNATAGDFEELWFDYLDLGRDYGAIKERLVQKDAIMEKAIEFGHGIRLLRQDLWETLISFIISSNNRIPRIMKIIGAIAGAYGEELQLKGKRYYTFPPAGRLAVSSVEELDVCRGGYRCKYIINSARMLHSSVLDLERLKGLGTEEAREEIMRLPGVGPKVADCILLYSGTRYDVFPTDVWVKRVMEELYFKKETSIKDIQRFVREYFGELAGFAQQYLFYYARENRIGV